MQKYFGQDLGRRNPCQTPIISGQAARPRIRMTFSRYCSKYHAVKRILFADDDPLVARIYRDKLADEGFDVAVAEDGVVAMKRLVEFKPDVVVLDLLMPKMNGADVIKFTRQHAELKDTPVIVFSNSLLAALAEPAATEGVEQIPKSTATPGQLIDLIHKALLPKPRAAAAVRLRVATPSATVPPAESPRPPVDKAKGTEFRNRVQQEF